MSAELYQIYLPVPNALLASISSYTQDRAGVDWFSLNPRHLVLFRAAADRARINEVMQALSDIPEKRMTIRTTNIDVVALWHFV